MDRLTSLATALGERLKTRSDTVAVAESSAGGLISAALLAVPGASAYFLGGGVIYTRAARGGLLGLPEDVIAMRAATEEYALIVARAIRERRGATWGLCETGASGPTGNRYGDRPRTRVLCHRRPAGAINDPGNRTVGPGREYVALRQRILVVFGACSR